MSDHGLGGDAVALLLTLMETPEAELTGGALQDFYPAAGAALIAAGALQPSGYEPVVTCLDNHDDEPVSVTWRDDLNGYAYFSSSVGWVKVDHERLRRYRVDFLWLLATLARQLRVPCTIEPQCLVDHHLWELGPAWIGHRKHMTPVYLGRRLHYTDVLEAACQALRERANGRTGLLLITGTAPPSFVTIPGNPVIVPLRSCLVIGAGLTLDADNLASRLGGDMREQPPLQIIGEGRLVRFYGETFEFPRGDKQRRVLVYLYEQSLEGIYEVPWAEIVAELNLPTNTRADKLFKDSPAWNRLLTMRNSMCSFCWPDAEADRSGDAVFAVE